MNPQLNHKLTVSGPAPLILAVGLTPPEGADADFDAWYREEHLADLSKCPGYIRSRRFKIVQPGSEESAPKYISFHEFEGDELPMRDLLKTTETEWSKKCMGSALKTEMNVWRLIDVFGDKEIDF